MRQLIVASCTLLAACGGSPSTASDGGVDAFVDPNTPYEHGVLDATWTKLPAAPTTGAGSKQDDIFFVDPMLGYIASGPTWSIQKTTDGGTTWAPVFTKQGTYFRSVAFLDAQHGFAGNLGAGLDPSISDATVLYETKDGGTTWAAVTSITGPVPKGVCNLTVIDSTHLVAVGRANGPSFVLASSDAGASWSAIDESSQLAMLVDAHFTSPSEGLLVGMDRNQVCGVFHTNDGGKTLDEVFASMTPGSLCWKINFSSPLVGYVAIQDGTEGPPTFAKTIDGGKSWAELPLPVQGDPATGYPAIGIGFITDKVGWVSPEDAAMPTYRTSDGGLTWTVDPALKSPINRFRFVDKNTAYAIGRSVWKLNVTF